MKMSKNKLNIKIIRKILKIIDLKKRKKHPNLKKECKQNY